MFSKETKIVDYKEIYGSFKTAFKIYFQQSLVVLRFYVIFVFSSYLLLKKKYKYNLIYVVSYFLTQNEIQHFCFAVYTAFE